MLTIPRSVRIFIGSTPVDMRKSIDGVMAIVQGELEQDDELLPHNWKPRPAAASP